ncbi:hypothetical protein [Shewanella sp. YIC-542]|uniref:hypothetical protein n=1 Tax=Shewanella mytili TaxID=3377111 RepID=UPI00398EB751
MKYQGLIVMTALLALGGCGGSDDDNSAVTPPTPEPTYVSINDATSLKVSVDGVDAVTKAITFSLSTDAGVAVTDAGANYSVMYLNFPEEQVSAFSIPWHNGVRFTCSEGNDCSGTLAATETAGQYLFTPGSLEKLGDATGQLKLAINIAGTLAQAQTGLVEPPAPKG